VTNTTTTNADRAFCAGKSDAEEAIIAVMTPELDRAGNQPARRKERR
jgi:hypothetical protein